jgi:O-antigen/teichoic acid export membrane protein
MKLFKWILNREFRSVFINQIILILGVFITTKILTNVLSKADYGYYALALSIVTLISMLPFSAFDQAVMRYISIYKDNNEYKERYSSIIGIYLAIFLIYTFIFTVSFRVIKIPHPWNDLFTILMFYLVFYTLSNTVKSIERANRNTLSILISNLFDLTAKIGVLIFLWKIDELTIRSTFTAFGIIFAIVVIYFGAVKNKFSLKLIDLKIFRRTFIELYHFSYPLIVWASFGWLQNMINRWYLNYFIGSESVADFALMSSLVLTGINSFSGIVNSYVIPIIYQRENTEKGFARKTVNRIIPKVIMFYTAVFVILVFFNKEIILLLADSNYMNSSWMLPIMFLASSIYSVGMMTTFEIYSDKKTKKLILSSITPGLFSLVGGFFLIKEFSINGALISFVISYALYGILTFQASYMYRKLKLDS